MNLKKVLLDALFVLGVVLDMVSSLILQAWGYAELNPVYVWLGHYGFWLVYVLGNFGVYLLFQEAHKKWLPGRWRAAYVILLLPAAAHLFCAWHNFEVALG